MDMHFLCTVLPVMISIWFWVANFLLFWISIVWLRLGVKKMLGALGEYRTVKFLARVGVLEFVSWGEVLRAISWRGKFLLMSLGWVWVFNGVGWGMNRWCFLRNLFCAVSSWTPDLFCGVAWFWSTLGGLEWNFSGWFDINCVWFVGIDRMWWRVFVIWHENGGELEVRFGAGNMEDGVRVFREVGRLRYFVVCSVSVI